ncbi:peptide/nickel transport system substrate-binding protein [Rhodococcus sp. OK519]|uniref:ABC transporter substrate-binding protein n=1 Tax=Rhodococcus sp. OK519 TaxID=2135729 RepID=UPI000D3D2766|nr:peptide/nickel transport system substrate-binding protein [Rhodococcus sp. OK519]
MTQRRHRARRLLAVALAGTAMTATACGSGSSSATSGSTTAGSGEYDRTAALTVSVPSPSTILDPALQNNIGQNVYTFLIYDALTQLDADYNVKPMLATAWTFAPDGSSLDLTLRDDVKFHDGTVFDAGAVKTNIERGKSMPGSTIAAQLAPITAVDVVSPTAVRLMLEPGQGASLPAQFALNAGMMVSPKALTERASELATNPGTAGSGAYLPTKVNPGVQVDFEKAADYWDQDAGFLQSMKIQYSADTAARLNGVRTGALDLAQIAGSTPVQEAKALVTQGAIAGDTVPQLSIQGLLFNSARGDLTKPEVRQAIGHAIDKDALVKGLFSGNARVADQFYPEGFWAHSDSLANPYLFDAAKAKDLVARAGGAAVTISAAAGSTNQVVAEAVQAQLEAVGIDATVEMLPQAQIDGAFMAGDLQSQANSVQPQPDPAGTVTNYVTAGYKIAAGNDTVQALSRDAADPRKSEAERAALYDQIWQILADDANWVPILRSEQVWAKSKSVTNVDTLPWIRSGFPNLRTLAVVG